VSLNLTAEVEPLAPGGGVPTGTVSFMMKKKRLGTAILSGGQATLAVKPGSVLNKSISIIYSGASEFRPASLTTTKLTSPSLAAVPHPLLAHSRSCPAIGRPLVRAGAKAGTSHATLSLISTNQSGASALARLEKPVSPP
jgi:hypothetical protein